MRRQSNAPLLLFELAALVALFIFLLSQGRPIIGTAREVPTRGMIQHTLSVPPVE